MGATRASLPIIPFRPFTRREPVVLYQPGLLRIGFEYDAPSKRWHVTKLEDLSLGSDDAMVAKLTKAVGEHCGPVPPKYDPDDFENTPSEGVCHFFWQRCMQLGEESGTPAWWTGETKVVLTKNLGWCAIYDLHFSRSKEGRWTLDRVEQVEACRGA